MKEKLKRRQIKMRNFLVFLIFLSSWAHYGCLGSSDDDKITVKKDTKIVGEKEEEEPKNPEQPKKPQQTESTSLSISTFHITHSSLVDLSDDTDNTGDTGDTDDTDDTGESAGKGINSKTFSLNIVSPLASKWYITHKSTFDPQAQASIDSEGTTWNWLTAQPTSYTLPLNVSDGEVTLVLWVADTQGKILSAKETFTLDTTAPVLDFDADTTTDKPADNAVDSQVSFELTATDLTKVSYSYCLGANCNPIIIIANFPLALNDSQVPFGSNSITIRAIDALGHESEDTYTWTRYRCAPNSPQRLSLRDEVTNTIIGTKSRDCAGTGLTWGSWQVSECIAGYDNTRKSFVCAPTVAGFFSAADQTGKTDCSAGGEEKPADSHWSKKQQGLTQASDCAWDCNAGFYKNVAAPPSDPSAPPIPTCTAVSDGFVATEGSTAQTQCTGNKIPNQDKNACKKCPTGKHANTDNIDCEPNTKNCDSDTIHGQGIHRWSPTPREWKPCKVRSCEGGYYLANPSDTTCTPVPKDFFSLPGDLTKTSCSDHITLPRHGIWVDSGGSGGAAHQRDCVWDCETGYSKDVAQNSCPALPREQFLITNLQDVSDPRGRDKKAIKTRSLSLGITFQNVGKWHVTHDNTFDPNSSANAASEGTNWSWISTKPTTYSLPADLADGEITLYLWTADPRRQCGHHRQTQQLLFAGHHRPRHRCDGQAR